VQSTLFRDEAGNDVKVALGVFENGKPGNALAKCTEIAAEDLADDSTPTREGKAKGTATHAYFTAVDKDGVEFFLIVRRLPYDTSRFMVFVGNLPRKDTLAFIAKLNKLATTIRVRPVAVVSVAAK
jgi:hypothetical protein